VFDKYIFVQAMFVTTQKSAKEIAIFVIYLSMGVLVFSTLVFYCESSQPDTLFESIPATFWWAVITMTTIGYGDMFPITIAGKFQPKLDRYFSARCLLSCF
jgi:hypothetical protein